MIRLICLLLLTIGCGRPSQHIVIVPSEEVQDELNSIVEHFQADYVKFTGRELPRYSLAGLRIQLTNDIDQRKLGECFLGANDIYLNDKEWNKLDASAREYIVYHEMGHCVLGIDYHIDDTFSVMNTVAGAPQLENYKRDREFLLAEFFNHAENKR